MSGPVFKLRSTLEGTHIVQSIFVAACEGATFQKAGEVRFADTDGVQWMMFGATLAVGCDLWMKRNGGDGPILIREGEEAVVEALAARAAIAERKRAAK